MDFFDSYNRRARLYPAILAIAPAIAFATIAIRWDQIGLPEIITTAALGVLFVGFADLARRFGRRVEPKIFEAAGGRMKLLSHQDGRLDPVTKRKYLVFLGAKLEETPPSLAAEQMDSESARAFYERCSTWLREQTRDKDRFGVLFEENKTYGFRRNLYGLKAVGLALNSLVVLACITILSRWVTTPIAPTRGQVVAVLVIAGLHAAYFLLAVTRRSVVAASDIYARQLLLSCEVLMKDKAPDA